jgi:hypothetical protein
VKAGLPTADPGVPAATLVVAAGVCVAEGFGTCVVGLLARAVVLPPLPQPQLDQLEGFHPQPPVRQPVEEMATAAVIEESSNHREIERRMAPTSLSCPNWLPYQMADSCGAGLATCCRLPDWSPICRQCLTSAWQDNTVHIIVTV